MRPLVVVTFVWLLVLTGCSGADHSTDGAIVIVDDAGNVVVHDVIGGGVRVVTELADDRGAFQPIWLGSGIAYLEIDGQRGALVVVEQDGTEQRRAGFDTTPFYAFPQPGMGLEAPVVILRNAVAGGLTAELVGADGLVTDLSGGAPYYFTWSEEGEVVAHIGNDRLARMHPTTGTLDSAPGVFTAPWESTRGIVYLRRGSGGQRLTLWEDSSQTDVATIDGFVQFVVAGDRVALRSVESVDATQVVFQSLPQLPSNTLVVVDLDTRQVEVVTRRDVLMFFWDQDGNLLVYADVTDEGDAVQWHVWDDGEITDYGIFQPDPQWVSTFVQFFDQYAQSMSLWSPGGDAFAFAGTIGDQSGVWVQYLERDQPERIATGSWVAWPRGG